LEGKTLWTIARLLKLAESFDTPEAKAFREFATLTFSKNATQIVANPVPPAVSNPATENVRELKAIKVSSDWLEPMNNDWC
jgi:hypothetical protein